MVLRPRRWRLISCWLIAGALAAPARAGLRTRRAEPGAGIPRRERPCAAAERGRGSTGRAWSGWCSRPTRCSGRWRSARSSRWVTCWNGSMALRRDRVIPREFADRFLERLSSGKLDRERALELCRAHDRPAARVFAMVVGAWGQPGRDDPADPQLRRRRRGRRAEAQPPGPERDGDARAAPGPARHGRRDHPVVRRARRTGRPGPRRGPRPRDQPGAGRHRASAWRSPSSRSRSITSSSIASTSWSASWTIAPGRSSSWSPPRSQRLGPTDRRHLPLPAADPHRQESRVL